MAIPETQRDLFRIIWFKENDIDIGKKQTFCFTRHVWGINSSPYIALTATNNVVNENVTAASQMTSMAIEENRYMDDMLLACDSLSDLATIASESRQLFAGRRFKLRKWITNSDAASILHDVPKCDLARGVGGVDLRSQPLPDSKALRLLWDPENDRLQIRWENSAKARVRTRRDMSSKLACMFDPLGMAAPFLLGGKLILQSVATSGFGWDDQLPHDILRKWEKWVDTLATATDLSLARDCFPGYETISCDKIVYQLHDFCDALNSAMSCVIYLRRTVNGASQVSFLLGNSRLVLSNQSNWVISRKELEAAQICSELMLLASKALHRYRCSIHFWTDSQVVLKWIVNPDLHLAHFVKRGVDKILVVSSPEAWNYVNTSVNPADVGTRESSVKHADSVNHLLNGPVFLRMEGIEPRTQDSCPIVRVVTVNEKSLIDRVKSRAVN